MNINHYTKIFIKNIMLGLGNVHLSLTNHDHVLHAVEKAYIAMSPRTFDKLRADAEIDVVAKKAVLSELAQKSVDYFKAPAPATQAKFDEWHRETCEWFIDEFNDRVMRPSGYKDIEYGKAQKIVNIAFKYLYLFCDVVPGNPSHFTFCHFAIDSITLAWYKKHIDPKCSIGNWSDMTYGEYIEIQKNIRAYISKHIPDKTPFEAEFEIWSDLYYGK
jgi:hypothetical protein